MYEMWDTSFKQMMLMMELYILKDIRKIYKKKKEKSIDFFAICFKNIHILKKVGGAFTEFNQKLKRIRNFIKNL